MGKSAEDAQQLIEKMVSNNYQWVNKRGLHRRTANMYEIDICNMLEAKLKNMLEKVLVKPVESSTNHFANMAYYVEEIILMLNV